MTNHELYKQPRFADKVMKSSFTLSRRKRKIFAFKSETRECRTENERKILFFIAFEESGSAVRKRGPKTQQ